MGCDITVVTEVKINGVWHAYGTPDVDRNYDLFAKMAGVRSDPGDIPIALPRGLPEDASVLARHLSDHRGSDAFAHSYLTGPEIVELEEWWWMRYRDSGVPRHFESEFGYFYQNSWSDFVDGSVKVGGIEDVRFVFWFDN